MIKILLLTLLELEIKKRDDIVFQDKKIPQGVAKAIMQFWVLQHFRRPKFERWFDL